MLRTCHFPGCSSRTLSAYCGDHARLAPTPSTKATPSDGPRAATIVCALSDRASDEAAVALAATVAARLRLRLLLVDLRGSSGREPRIAAEEHIPSPLRRHVSVEVRRLEGDSAMRIAEAAADEAAEMIVVGAEASGLRGSSLESRLANELEAETQIPVVLAAAEER
jgi:nucleotide-binding universal stress UspA family protein